MAPGAQESSPLVTIAIVTYNQEAFIEAAIVGALAQDWPNLEVVVADDGSTDGTREVVEACIRRAAPGKLRLETGPNVGITANCNRAWRASRGALVGFLGGDDILLPGKVQAQARWLLESPRRVLCAHDVEHFDSDSDARMILQSEITPLRSGVGAEDIIARGNPFAAPAVMLRSSAIPAYGFDERLPRVSDAKLWIDCIGKAGEWGYVDGILARYRRHPGSISISSAEACFAESLLTLDLVEQANPDWAKACAKGRARLHHRDGVEKLRKSADAALARDSLWRSIRAAPSRSWKVPLWLALTYLPTNLRRELFRLRGVEM